MNAPRRFTAAMVATSVIAFSSYAGAADQAPAASPPLTAAQLEQLVAPIALYPDSLMTQVLMASTYPLEIVEASRWVKKNPGLKGDALDAGLKNQDWDPSVKSLCTLPDLLNRMNDNLDWTQDLGDAFLAQQADVLDTVQRMRAKAYDAGNLKTTEQQTVVVKQEEGAKIIVVQQASPQVVYVPTYSPAVVYGPAWAYPAPYYPAMYAPPGYGLLAFGTGMAVGAAIWGNANWGGHGNNDVSINTNNYNNFNNRTNTGDINRGSGNTGKWNHNPEHRKGVNYKNSQTAQKYGASAGQNRVTKDQARGYADRVPIGRAAAPATVRGATASAVHRTAQPVGPPAAPAIVREAVAVVPRHRTARRGPVALAPATAPVVARRTGGSVAGGAAHRAAPPLLHVLLPPPVAAAPVPSAVREARGWIAPRAHAAPRAVAVAVAARVAVVVAHVAVVAGAGVVERARRTRR